MVENIQLPEDYFEEIDRIFRLFSLQYGIILVAEEGQLEEVVVSS